MPFGHNGCTCSGVSSLFPLQLVHRTLVPASQSATAGHMTLLKQKVLTAILRRLDITLFQKLVQGEHFVKSVSCPFRLHHQTMPACAELDAGRRLRAAAEQPALDMHPSC